LAGLHRRLYHSAVVGQRGARSMLSSYPPARLSALPFGVVVPHGNRCERRRPLLSFGLAGAPS